jgi:hypothetical protein
MRLRRFSPPSRSTGGSRSFRMADSNPQSQGSEIRNQESETTKMDATSNLAHRNITAALSCAATEDAAAI